MNKFFIFICLFITKKSIFSLVYNLTDENFNNITNISNTSDSRWFIMFFAPWCPHCKKFLPLFQNLSNLYENSTKFGSVDWFFYFFYSKNNNSL